VVAFGTHIGPLKKIATIPTIFIRVYPWQRRSWDRLSGRRGRSAAEVVP
jgi:hypothetical protein